MTDADKPRETPMTPSDFATTFEAAIAERLGKAIKKLVSSSCRGTMEGPSTGFVSINDISYSYKMFGGRDSPVFPTPAEAALWLRAELLAEAGMEKIVVWRRDPEIVTDGVIWRGSARAVFVIEDVIS